MASRSDSDFRALQDLLHQAEQRAEQAEQRAGQAEQRAEQERQRNRQTTLPEVLHACYVHLSQGLRVENAHLSTRGDPANAKGKIRPLRCQPWTTFSTQQESTWAELMDSDFVDERHFDPIITLETEGKKVRALGSELDLRFFEQRTVENHVASIIRELSANPSVKHKFGLRGFIQFENHANMLDVDPSSPDQSSIPRLHRPRAD
ncbi:MAG: hypothetical protein M1825_000344 [Sarcosagium campestre]|nr:MAG: hypothetical protein M1825_000344 [Sarcosagium campestre]